MSKKTIFRKQSKYDVWILAFDGEITLTSRSLTYECASLVMGLIDREVLDGVRPMIVPVEMRKSIQLLSANPVSRLAKATA